MYKHMVLVDRVVFLIFLWKSFFCVLLSDVNKKMLFHYTYGQMYCKTWGKKRTISLFPLCISKSPLLRTKRLKMHPTSYKIYQHSHIGCEQIWSDAWRLRLHAFLCFQAQLWKLVMLIHCEAPLFFSRETMISSHTCKSALLLRNTAASQCGISHSLCSVWHMCEEVII